MFDQSHPPISAMTSAAHMPCLPVVTTRRATLAELHGLAPWLAQQGLPIGAADIVIFADGSERHAPETVAAYRLLMRDAPTGTGLLYLHCGVQAQSLDPLLPGLLYLTGHCGPVHALRHAQADGQKSDLSPDATAFLRAMTPAGGCTLVIDDRQNRVAAVGCVQAAPVTLTLFHRATADSHPKEHAPHDND